MADIPLNHLSRPQLVHLLLRIVDLLSQPVQPATHTPTGPTLEPYDASIDPWNEPEAGQSTGVAGSGCTGFFGDWQPLSPTWPFEPLCLGFLSSCVWDRAVLSLHQSLHQDFLGLGPFPSQLVLARQGSIFARREVGYQVQANHVRMHYQVVAHGIMCVGADAVSAGHPVRCSVQGTLIICVLYTRFHDIYVREIPAFSSKEWFCIFANGGGVAFGLNVVSDFRPPLAGELF